MNNKKKKRLSIFFRACVSVCLIRRPPFPSFSVWFKYKSYFSFPPWSRFVFCLFRVHVLRFSVCFVPELLFFLILRATCVLFCVRACRQWCMCPRYMPLCSPDISSPSPTHPLLGDCLLLFFLFCFCSVLFSLLSSLLCFSFSPLPHCFRLTPSPNPPHRTFAHCSSLGRFQARLTALWKEKKQEWEGRISAACFPLFSIVVIGSPPPCFKSRKPELEEVTVYGTFLASDKKRKKKRDHQLSKARQSTRNTVGVQPLPWPRLVCFRLL